MKDDRIGRQVRVLGAGQRPALQALARIGDRALIRRLGDRQALQPDVQARVVHHGEHRAHAAMRLAQQPAGRLLEAHDARRRAVDAHLVLDPGAHEAVARPGRAISFRQELRHQEQADAARALGRIRQAREHQMHDVRGQILLARGDEDLGAGDRVRAVVVGLGAGADQAEVGAALRLGQAHGAAPRARGQLRQIERLQLFGGVGLDRQIRAGAQPRIVAEREIRRADHLVHDDLDRFGQALAAVPRIGRKASPAPFDEPVVGLLEALGRAHHAVLVDAALLVTRAIDREQHVLAELRALLDHRIDHVCGRLLVARQPAQLLDVEQLVQDEAHVALRRVIRGHGWSVSCEAACRSRACARAGRGLRGA